MIQTADKIQYPIDVRNYVFDNSLFDPIYGGPHIICQLNCGKFCAIELSSNNRWANPVEINDFITKFSKEALQKVFDNTPLSKVKVYAKGTFIRNKI